MDFVSEQLTQAHCETKDNSKNTAATDKHVFFDNVVHIDGAQHLVIDYDVS